MKFAATLVVCAILLPGAAAAQSGAPESEVLVKQLLSAMKARGLDSIAVADPADPGRFVAALVYPEVQVLAVSGKHNAVDYLKLQLEKKNFQEVYILLQQGVPAGRLLFHDMGADGFRPSENNVDVYYEGKSDKTMLDGKWEAQSLTEQAYLAKVKQADIEYTRVLTLLLEATRKLPVPTSH